MAWTFIDANAWGDLVREKYLIVVMRLARSLQAFPRFEFRHPHYKVRAATADTLPPPHTSLIRHSRP